METSYLGVQYTPRQAAILHQDLAVIDSLNNELNALQNEYINLNNQIVNNNHNIEACTTAWRAGTLKESQCLGPYQDTGNFLTNQMNQISWTSIPSKNGQILQARKNYNEDLYSIQNEIKLQIQANQTNDESARLAAENKAKLLQNDPTLLRSMNDNATKVQIELDKAKKDQNVKVAFFVVGAIIVLGLGIYFIRKLI